MAEYPERDGIREVIELIVEEQELKEKLEQSSEEKVVQLETELVQYERFAAMIAQELRSPLTPIIN